jgi:hypothetical protein
MYQQPEISSPFKQVGATKSYPEQGSMQLKHAAQHIVCVSILSTLLLKHSWWYHSWRTSTWYVSAR